MARAIFTHITIAGGVIALDTHMVGGITYGGSRLTSTMAVGGALDTSTIVKHRGITATIHAHMCAGITHFVLTGTICGITGGTFNTSL